MKYLIVVLVIVAVGWWLLRPRVRDLQRRGAAAALPKPMVQCLHCGVHLPRADAVLDSRGAFCTEAHRLAGPREP